MEIQSDLIILEPNSYLPLPWSVRGPLGLETGSEVSLALVESKPDEIRMPDIVVTPLRSEFLHRTFTVEVELGERPGAVADFLSWFGDKTENNGVNIVLSETITLEGRFKHKIHLVIEPARENNINLQELENILKNIKDDDSLQILSSKISPTYSEEKPIYLLEQKVLVDNGWLKYDGWLRKIKSRYGDAVDSFDLTKLVVSSSPDQRLLRYIIPKKGVIELRVPHQNKPGALKEISDIIKSMGCNILSSRLSRTPPRPSISSSTSVFVAACEPPISFDSNELRHRLGNIETSFMVDDVAVSYGRPAPRTLYLTPRRTERVELDADMAIHRERIRAEAIDKYSIKHGARPKKFVFLSRRFIDRQNSGSVFEEQRRTIQKIILALESQHCAVIEAADPGDAEDRYQSDIVYKAVFSRLWASDACLVLAMFDDGSGNLSLSIAHEIGFFTGRNRPVKVFVSKARERDPVFGNTVGKNRIEYADQPIAFIDEEPDSIFSKVSSWAKTISRQS